MFFLTSFAILLSSSRKFHREHRIYWLQKKKTELGRIPQRWSHPEGDEKNRAFKKSIGIKRERVDRKLENDKFPIDFHFTGRLLEWETRWGTNECPFCVTPSPNRQTASWIDFQLRGGEDREGGRKSEEDDSDKGGCDSRFFRWRIYDFEKDKRKCMLDAKKKKYL